MSKPQVPHQHPYTLEPVFEELERILIIMQNSDGTWGTAESLDDRLFPTGWAVLALRSTKTTYSLELVKKLLKMQIIPEFEDHFQIPTWSHAKKLCGFFLLLPYIYQDKLWISSKLFHKNLQALINQLRSKSWINNQVASYFAFSCSSIPDLKDAVQSAKDQLKNISIGETPTSEMAYICLGYPEVLYDVLKNERNLDEFMNSIGKLTDEQLSHLLLGFSLLNNVKDSEVLKNALIKVKEEIAVRLRNRQLTELDRKVTKEFLDLLLLLRAMIPLDELRRRLRQLDNQIFIEEVVKTNRKIRVVTEIPSGRLQEILGRIEIPTISCYVLSSINLDESRVHLVPSKDYVKVSEYFRQKTMPIPEKRLLSYEILLSFPILAIEAYIYNLLYIVLSRRIADVLPPEYSSYLLILTVIVHAAIFIGLATFTVRFFKLFLPELTRSVYERLPHGFKRVWRVLGGLKDDREQ